MYPVSYLMNSEQYCEDLDEAFHGSCLCCLRLFAPQPAHISTCHIQRTGVTNYNNNWLNAKQINGI